jgi:hypothetical protein
MAAYQPVVRVCGTRWRRELCFDTVDTRYIHEDHTDVVHTGLFNRKTGRSLIFVFILDLSNSKSE